ncbi:MAG: hypothetical protein V3S21_10515 [Xanthomonadales bacterium]
MYVKPLQLAKALNTFPAKNHAFVHAWAAMQCICSIEAKKIPIINLIPLQFSVKFLAVFTDGCSKSNQEERSWRGPGPCPPEQGNANFRSFHHPAAVNVPLPGAAACG